MVTISIGTLTANTYNTGNLGTGNSGGSRVVVSQIQVGLYGGDGIFASSSVINPDVENGGIILAVC